MQEPFDREEKLQPNNLIFVGACTVPTVTFTQVSTMPNTLAHLGIQGILTRTTVPRNDLKWVYIGCVIPDLPWISQRIVRTLYPAVDRYDLLLYSSVQSSLIFCLLLAAALALTTRPAGRTFLVLGLNCTLHLLLDATQIKWANGVMLFAPVSWQLTSFNLYWPEAIPSLGLTVLGLCFVVFFWKKACNPVEWQLKKNRLLAVPVLLLLAAYSLGPLPFIEGPLENDNYYAATLLKKSARTGKEIAFDRALLLTDKDGVKVRNYSNEWFTLVGFETEKETALISLKGHFLTPDRIKVADYHLHPLKARDTASIVGLFFILLIWLCSFQRAFRQKP